jgi:threonyl-tRNA synthetase
MSNNKDKEYLDSLRHSTSHLLAAAVIKLYPKAKPTLGPPIENGFYYDFDNLKVSEEDLPKIEDEMRKIVKEWHKFEKELVSPEKAKNEFKGNEFKTELIDEHTGKGEDISLYKSENFTDLCGGGHVDNPTKEIKHFKLLSIAGAYWRGNEKNKMLTRIYGTAFPTKKDLNNHLKNLEEIKKRDHRKLGKELDLFTFADEVGPGLPLWKPKGQIICEELEKWAKSTEEKWGYKRVMTPHIAKSKLYEISGHLPYYKDDMYSPMNIDDEMYYLRGMNCPHHHMVYKSSPKSYRDLPLRYAEYGEVYRYERSGELFGLMRVRFIQQNDAHIYCTLKDAEKEFLDVLKLHEYYYNTLGLTKKDYHIVVGLPDEKKRDKYHGDKKLWDKSENMMRDAINKSNIRSVDDVGGAAFYGPKIDFNIVSSVGREFGISTNQLDLYMPTRFNLTYTDIDGKEKLVAVIHRAPLGSHERFVGFLIEHFGGAFPAWLHPVQVKALPITNKNLEYSKRVTKLLSEQGVRAELDDRNETLQSKIRDAQLEKVPYMLVIGDKEEKSESVAVRLRTGKDLGQVKLKKFIKNIKEKVESKSLKL